MKKNYMYLLLFLSALIFESAAQTPTYSNQAGGIGNTQPFNVSLGANCRTQWFIPPGALGVPPGNAITAVYFQFQSAATRLYPQVNLRMKTGSGTSLPTGAFETGLTTVFTDINYTIISLANGWYKITLQTPFSYDPTQPLVVDFEHNATTGTGPNVLQTATTSPGPWVHWSNYGAASPASSSTTRMINLGVDVIPNTPCSGVPPMNAVAPASFTTCAGLANPTLGLAQNYTLGGLSYQWYTSTTTPVGPYNAVSGATANAIQIPTVAANAWYQLVVNCTNPGGGTATLSPSEIFVAGSTTNNVRYFEDFEGVQMEGRLPNCSWDATSLNNGTGTFMGAKGDNRIPRSGNNYASFSNVAGDHYYFTNGIWMEPNITYSTSMWYRTDLAGSSNFTNLELMLGSTQSSIGLTPIVAVNGPVISPVYKSLSYTFAVNSPGLYHVAVKVTAAVGGAPYLTWDDLEVMIPCTPPYNPVAISIGANSSTICEFSSVALTASGAHTYTWHTGANGQSISDAPAVTSTYSVSGTNTITGCSADKSTIVTVLPAPVIFASAHPPVSCSGKPVTLSAAGGLNYMWSTTAAGQQITVSPANTSTYQVIGTNSNNCSSSANVIVVVNPNPLVSGNTSKTDACIGDAVVLTGSGADDYQWIDLTGATVLQGNNITVYPQSSAGYLVTGTDKNNCSGTAFVAMNVVQCVGLKEAGLETVKVYPNPARELLNVESGSLISSVEIADLSGRTVLILSAGDNQVAADISALTPGVYMVKVSTVNGVERQRLIKN